MKTSMFIIGSIIFTLYMAGLLYMVNWGHKSQEEESLNDPETKNSKKD
jgi:hypothetical protein